MSVTVRVALRVRPLNENEREVKSQQIISYIKEDEKQIQIMDQDRRRHFFTFDHVYSPNISQADVYHSCIQPLFDQFLKGYNATVLAYGQTGSGKTYSMGTSINIHRSQEGNDGIVPRFTENLFKVLKNHKQQDQDKQYQVKVSFLELYNEDIIDLLNPKRETSTSVNIRQDTFGNISWSGVHDQLVQTSADLLNCLYQGSIARTTGSTDMNSESSRSHAIFSVTLIQQLSTTVTTSKFHFVDLAGSERLKRTNAKGDRAKEGISINSGLLALGNVISALGGDEKKKHQLQQQKKNNNHVPYRNSKLTRLLQDSLGGNSQTLMLACVSPSDLNTNETLSTLKYANRAKNITNRVVMNQELSEVDTMKQEISRLKQELQINDAFIKEVHMELNDLRAQNLALMNGSVSGIPNLVGQDETMLLARSQQQGTKLPFLPSNKKHHKKNTSSITVMDDLDDDEAATLVGSTTLLPPFNHSNSMKSHRSTSTKRRKKKENSSTTTSNTFLDKHKNRTRKESLFIKQIKSNKDASLDPVLFMKLANMFQSSVREQKQLVHYIEQQQESKGALVDVKVEKSTSTKRKSASKTAAAPSTTTAMVKRNSKPSMIKQPNTITLQSNRSNNSASSSGDETTHHRLTYKVEENQTSSTPLKQIVVQVKKAISLLSSNENSPLVQQLRPILNKMTAICNSTRSITTTTTKSSEMVVVKKGNKTRLLSSSTAAMSKRVSLDDLHREIKRYIALENIKTNPICLEMTKSLKQKKLKLIREQKDLIKERKTMLKEFYPDEQAFADEQQKQQYMDERIDVITVQVDYITEQLQLLQPSIHKNKQQRMEKEALMELLKPLKEQELRSLLWMVIQQDLVTFNVTSELYQLTENVLMRYQQGMIQLRRDNTVKMNNQILMNLLNSAPCKCLSNGLILLNAAAAVK